MIDLVTTPLPLVVEKAAAALRAGGIVALPTDTVYGLAAVPDVPGATGRLFELKGRAADVPLAVLCADVLQAVALVDDPSDQVQQLARRYWPGPLTLVLPRRAGLGYELGQPATTIGVRCPDHALVRALASAVGPIATTSANRHGQSTPVDAAGVDAQLGRGLALLLDGGPCTGDPSTVLDTTTDPWQVLRQGSLSITLD